MRCEMFTLREIPVIVCRAHTIPQGIKPAFATIKSRLNHQEKRQFFGLIYQIEEEPEYYAAVQVHNRKDSLRLELPKMVIPGGLYVRSLLPVGPVTPSRMMKAFRTMEARFPFDTWRPKIEFYRDGRRPHLYLPIRQDTTAE